MIQHVSVTINCQDLRGKNQNLSRTQIEFNDFSESIIIFKLNLSLKFAEKNWQNMLKKDT